MRHSHSHLSRERALRSTHGKLRTAFGIVFCRSGTDEKETVPTVEIIMTGFSTFQEEPPKGDPAISARSLAASPEALGVRLVHREQAHAVS